VGLTLPCKKKIVEKPPKNSAGFYGGSQSLSWAVEPREEEEEAQSVQRLGYELDDRGSIPDRGSDGNFSLFTTFRPVLGLT
jgi:hypothetical protein